MFALLVQALAIAEMCRVGQGFALGSTELGIAVAALKNFIEFFVGAEPVVASIATHAAEIGTSATATRASMSPSVTLGHCARSAILAAVTLAPLPTTVGMASLSHGSIVRRRSWEGASLGRDEGQDEGDFCR